MLSVVSGPFHPDLEQAFLEALRARKGPVAIVAPSRRLADRLQRLACVEGGLALLDAHFHTFYSLAMAMVEEAGGLTERLVGDPVFHDAVVDGLLGGEQPRGLAGAVRASLRDLVDAGVSARELAEHFEGNLVADEHDKKSLSALLGLAQAYEARLAELNILSPSGLTRRAASLCADSALLGRFERVLYYGFYDLTGLQLEFFEAVCARADVTLFYPYVKGHPAFRFCDAFFEQKLMGAPRRAAPRAQPRPAVEPALERLFSGRDAAALPEGALRLLSASGARDEAWAAAKEILALVDSGVCAFDQIAVVARSLEPYRAVLADVFDENEIPCDLSGGEPLLRRPVARLAWTLLSLRRRDFPASAVFDLLGSPYCVRAPKPRQLSAWRAEARRLSIHAGWLQWRKLERREGQAQELWRIVSAWREELGAPLATWAELARSARALVERELALPERADELETAAYGAVFEAIDSLADFDLLGRPAQWENFLDALERKLKLAGVEPARSRRGVRVLGAMDARGEAFDAVLLLGLKEKSFPRQVQEDPILRESVRAALRHPAGYWISPKSAGYEEERLLFFLCCASARKRLTCVFPRSDEAGKAEVPSLYLRELCRASGVELSVARRVPRLPFERLQSVPPELLTPQELRLRLGEGGDERLAELNRAGGRPGAFDGQIAPPQQFVHVLEKEGVSPSALDELAACPFQFFAHRLLELPQAEEAVEQGELAPWLRGQVYHAVLERFWKDLPETLWQGADVTERLGASVEAVFSELGWRELGVYPVLWRAAKERMSARLAAFVAWDLAESRRLGLKPLWFEKTLEGALPGGLKVKGRVDRVDLAVDRQAARVVDYKASWSKKLPRLVELGEHHQLPVYGALAAAALGLDFVPGAILSVEDDAARQYDFTAADWKKLGREFLAGVSRRIEAVAAGRFPISPDEGEWGHCARCDYRTVCRKSHAPSRARALS